MSTRAGDGRAVDGQGQWITDERDGKLAYARDAKGNSIPDFSNCGYRGGGVALPDDVPVKVTVQPQSGNDKNADDGARIQAAIDEVGKLTRDARGIRGAVLLTHGTYRIGGAVHLTRGGVVLRGQGEGDDGTVIVATGKDRRAVIQTGAGAHAAGRGEDDEEAAPKRDTHSAQESAAHAVTDPYVPVGARAITLDSTAGLKAGDEIDVHRPSTENWIKELGMDHIPPRKNGGVVNQWTAGSKDLNFDRVITAIDGDRVSLDAPLVCALDSAYGGGDVRPWTTDRIREVGVEKIRGISEYAGDTDEEHSWTFISFSGVQDGWVRDVTSVHFANNLVVLGGDSKCITVQDSTCLDPISQITGGRRYSFSMNHCHLCLVQRCAGRNGRHDFVLGSLVAGPNVFLDCKAEKTHADSGPHHRWSVGVLYDRLDLPDGELNLRNRGNMGSGHGWAGADQVCWNCRVKSMIVENPPTAQNWAIGCTIKERKGDGIWDSIDKPVTPSSLYLAQLGERLGPEAVKNIARK